MNDIGRMFVYAGILLLIVGGIIMLVSRAGIPLGRLPGDIVYKGKSTTFYFPIVTCIVVSLILSFIFWLIARHR